MILFDLLVEELFYVLGDVGMGKLIFCWWVFWLVVVGFYFGGGVELIEEC